ncbi:MAG: hypothetical protein V9G13_08490 [Marmoricola sp.]
MTGRQLIGRGELAYLEPGADQILLTVSQWQRAFCCSWVGRPFGEQIVMWWNFIARSHEEDRAVARRLASRDLRLERLTSRYGPA